MMLPTLDLGDWVILRECVLAKSCWKLDWLKYFPGHRIAVQSPHVHNVSWSVVSDTVAVTASNIGHRNGQIDRMGFVLRACPTKSFIVVAPPWKKSALVCHCDCVHPSACDLSDLPGTNSCIENWDSLWFSVFHCSVFSKSELVALSTAVNHDNTAHLAYLSWILIN